MKSLLKFFLVIVAAGAFLASCDKVGKLPFYANGNAPVLTSDATTINPTSVDSDKTVINLTWTNPKYATDSATQKFIVEIDSTGHNFSNAYTSTVSGALATSFTAKQLNTIFQQMGFTPGTTFTVDIRVTSSYANNNEQYHSNVVTVDVTPYIVPITLTASSTNALTLTIDNASFPAVGFGWTATEFGGATIYYALQVDAASDNFANPQTLKLGQSLSNTFLTGDLNTTVLLAGGVAGVAADMQFRTVAYLDANYTVQGVNSNVVTINITPYLPFLYMYVPGDYQGWNPGAAPSIAATVPDLSAFEGYVNVPAGGTYQFKITSAPDWGHTNYGYGGDGILSADGGASNLTWPTGGGYYRLQANLSTLTWSATATTWGIIGDATPGGWGASTEMFYNTATNVWEIDNVALTAGGHQMKFRANDDWAINLGGDVNGLTYNGGNIDIAADGNYNITLDLSHPLKYTTTITKL